MAALPASLNRTAIVIGGSIAGLWTTRVLSDHFAQITVIERDQLPAQPEPRPGVPQSYQVHVLLRRGLQILEQLFPGLEAELLDAGAVRFDLVGDARTRTRGHWMPRYPTDKIMVGCSRMLLETFMRRRLQALPNVRFVEKTEVTGLRSDTERRVVTGVMARERDNGETHELAADFVVDASGRNSHTPQWLDKLGYSTPEESLVNAYLGYACRRYQRPSEFPADWKMMLVFPIPPNDPRGGLIYPEENDTWMVMLGGTMKDYPPTDEAGFMQFARSLGPEFWEAIMAAEPISSIRGYRRTENRWRHFEKLDRWPENFVVVGDAVCAFNPVYGQGMTVAAATALALGEALRQADGDLHALAPQFQRNVAKVTEPVWMLATGADYEWPGTEGDGRSWLTRVSHWYMDKLMDALPHDRDVQLTFQDVNHLIAPATALFAPAIALRVLRHHLTRQTDEGVTR